MKRIKNIKNILLLGATGSIGLQTIDVVKKNSDKLKITGLVSFSNKIKLVKIAKDLNCKNFLLVSSQPSILEANKKIIEMINSVNVDVVVNAMSGSAGLEASYETLKADKILALANKESLVVGGDLIMPLAIKRYKQHNEHRILPIDSEHGAIFQCLIGEDIKDVKNLWITASGGPFRGKSEDFLKSVTKKQALAHPTWNMGPKITIDSSTLMNKGLEVIEAHHLFNMPYDKIKVLVQAQSVIHSMVEYIDGSFKAHLGITDMRIPIQYALSFPMRWDNPAQNINFEEICKLTFEKPNTSLFKCLQYAYTAGNIGGTMPCIMNAANEIAVGSFLDSKCGFLDIPIIIEKAMSRFKSVKVESVEQLKVIDATVRSFARSLIVDLC